MATRSEQFRAQAQRGHSVPKGAKRAAAKPAPAKAKGRSLQHAAKNAIHALESSAAAARPSRKSTRESASRVKADTMLNIREALVKGSPEAKFRKSRDQSVRVRGSRH